MKAMSNSETLADIAREMRRHIQAARDYPQDIDITVGDVEDWADRIEAAYARESGNAAKMRAALVALAGAVCDYLQKGLVQLPLPLEDAYSVARAALAVPPRNCDVGTAEEQVKRQRNAMCDTAKPCPDPHWSCARCFAEWAQMPYEEGGAEC